jgi:hypothetical protein
MGMTNFFPVGNVYPTANSGRGASTGLKMGASGAFMGTPALTEVQNEGGVPAAATSARNPIAGQHLLLSGAVFLGLLLALMFTAKHIGTEDEFKNIKVSAYNVLVISLAAVVGIPVIKFLASKVPIPAVSAWAEAA